MSVTKSFNAHHQTTTEENETWLTPPEIIKELGPFDLDPCCPENMPWDTARLMLTKCDDGLKIDWPSDSFVWMNPPYGVGVSQWLAKLANHRNGIALVFARIETDAWHNWIWSKANAIYFPKGRVNFHYIDGARASANCGAPVAFVGYGPKAIERLTNYAKLNPGILCRSWQITEHQYLFSE